MRARSVPSLALLVVAVLAAPAAAQSPSTAPSTVPSAGPGAPRVAPCAKDMAEGFECVTLTVPLDHFQDTGKTTEVTFAIKRHTGDAPAKGVLVTATGGPGTSGIQSAVDYRDGFSESIRRDYDIVFFDQRGAHLSGDMTCPQAAAAFYRTTADPADSSATTGLGADAHAFVDDCLAESKADPTELPFYATSQVVEDLEAFRDYLGVDEIVLYGESYGTQLAQAYAAKHPDRIAALLIDGPVDLNRPLLDYLDEQSAGFARALEGTLFDCTTQAACARDVAGADLVSAWDALVERLDQEPATFSFHSAGGTEETRPFTGTDLVNAASAFLYSEDDRMLLQRALAAASQEDFWYLSRLLYSGLGVDPETQAAIPDPSYSDGLYYAVECLDYGLSGATDDERATTYLAEGHDRGMETSTLGDVFYGDLPCAYWPEQPADIDRPQPLADIAYPLFVMGATLDPATPWTNGERIAAYAGDTAYLIVKPGGPHVIFGRGEACPDDLVTAFLIDGTLPDSRRTVCPGDVADDYVRLPPLVSTQYASTRAALLSADREMTNAVDYVYWDGDKPFTTGCRFGGTITYTPSDSGSDLAMESCSWSAGLGLTGTGAIDDDKGTVELRVSQAGADGDRVRYARDPQGDISVRGELAMFADR